MLLHYFVLVLVLRVKEGRFLRKTLVSLEEIEKTFHIKPFVIILLIRFTLGLFVMLETFKFPMQK